MQRWLKQPLFSQTVKDAEAKAIDDLSRMLVRLLREDDPEPLDRCDRCGRVFTGLIRVYVLGIDCGAI